MIKIYPAESRHSGSHGWLQYNFSFSFADYYDPDNVSFGPLRVFNDDYIQPLKGFGTHPHREMEIVTVALAGQLHHEDNTGGKETLRPGEIQRMSAGTGILHSEVNNSDTETANILQLWFMPNEQGLKPSYEQKTYDISAKKNHLLPIVSNRIQSEQIAHIHQDLTIYLSDLDAGQSLAFSQAAGRRIYLFVIEGEITLNKESALKKRDAARITDVTELAIDAASDASFMLIDLP
ncbi:Quercetin 2,3-dioxygenase [Paenibacillus plantiphilus]|uniref:Quercetin 2,3-dioxygenase n=1 Tax=Paenibacillus plantiphilus TaxID=2905650 RepID=A0ABN8GSS0_9BACL|nr:pirin family protein [Paenibacillus plantiphilus]CAH1217265.1 Quercetin 2,3-dioxygenase [Paenibacillus plantiphilus]